MANGRQLKPLLSYLAKDEISVDDIRQDIFSRSFPCNETYHIQRRCPDIAEDSAF